MLPGAEPHLSEAEAEEVFGLLLDGAVGEEEIARFLVALSGRGETADEIAGAARALRARLIPIAAPAGAVDCCGTGGDGHHTLNVSTAVSLVVAACGVPVAKHGNKAQSSRSGTADAFSALGVNLDIPFERIPAVIREAGMVFLMAQRHHAALRHAAGPRVELGTRTIFNLLGPMANPGGVTRQMTGAFAPQWLRPMAEALGRLGSEHAWLVHGQGLDELTVSGPSQVVELRDGHLREFTVSPGDVGLPVSPVESLRGGDPERNAAALLALLDGVASPYRDCVVLNAAAALVVAGRSDDLREAARMAAASIDQGAARGVLERLRTATAP